MVPEPSRPFLLPGRFNPYAAARPATILVNRLKARDTGPLVDVAELAVPAAATAARARSLAATPDGKRSYKTAGADYGSRV